MAARYANRLGAFPRVLDLPPASPRSCERCPCPSVWPHGTGFKLRSAFNRRLTAARVSQPARRPWPGVQPAPPADCRHPPWSSLLVPDAPSLARAAIARGCARTRPCASARWRDRHLSSPTDRWRFAHSGNRKSLRTLAGPSLHFSSTPSSVTRSSIRSSTVMGGILRGEHAALPSNAAPSRPKAINSFA